MSMALVLEHTQEWLREKYGWAPNQCLVTHGAQPVFDAGYFFVGIDDSGVEPGPEDTDALKEVCNITIGVWLRPEHLQADKRGILKLPVDMYLSSSWSLYDIERAIIVSRSAEGAELYGLHHNWGFSSALNTRYSLPSTTYGAEFRGVFRYRGKGPMESLAMDDGSGNIHSWFGYRLRFRGMERIQKLRSATDAIG